MKKEPFRMEPSNLVCPRCSRGGYMYILHGSNVGELDIKCTNCETYFKSSEFYNTEPKRDTNHDRILAMDAQKLAYFLNKVETDGRVYGPMGENYWMKWLQQEYANGDSV